MQRPTLVNLQCDVEHPTQCMADMLHIIHQFGGAENLKGKKIAMAWAYFPSYGKALYLHCLPADITGVSCKEGEVDASVFDRYLVPLYKEASFKPYIIAAMILMSQVKDPVSCLRALDGANDSRKRF